MVRDMGHRLRLGETEKNQLESTLSQLSNIEGGVGRGLCHWLAELPREEFAQAVKDKQQSAQEVKEQLQATDKDGWSPGELCQQNESLEVRRLIETFSQLATAPKSLNWTALETMVAATPVLMRLSISSTPCD